MKRAITYLVLLIVVSTSVSLAQSPKNLSDNAVNNLITGINSENSGLKRSSIYFAGYYKVESVVDELKEVMLSDENPSTRILAALALYEIGDENLLSDLELVSQDSSEDIKVRKMTRAIYDHWISEKAEFISVTR